MHMNTFWILLIVFHLLSIGFMVFGLSNLFSYLRRYPLEENHHTLLFRCIRVEHIVLAYIFCIALFTISSFIFVSLLPS